MIAAAAVAAALAACPVEHAQYALRTQPEVTARFLDVARDEDWPAGIALNVQIGASGRQYWWLPWNGGSDGKQNVASTTDPTASGWKPGRTRPLGDSDFIATDAAYNLWDHVPVREEIAPAHLLIGELREALSYRAPADARDQTVRQFFDLVSCRP